MVGRIGYIDVAFPINGDACRQGEGFAVEAVFAEGGYEFAACVEDEHPIALRIGDVDAPVSDGQVGLVPQEDGSVGVFSVDGDGTIHVVHTGYDGGFYAEKVVVEPSGEAAWIVDGNWAENGGGLYRVDISCDDGSLSGTRYVMEAKLPADLLLARHRLDRALFVGREVAGASGGDDATLLDWSATPTPMVGVDAFGDDDTSVSDAALTFDDRYALLADNCVFCSGDNRVARGGSWFCSPNYCGAYSTHYRGASPPDHAFNNVGFRCAADADYE